MSEAAADPIPHARGRARLASLAVYLCAGLVVSVLAWAAWAEIDVRVAGRGRLVNTSQNIVVRPLDAGVLNTVRVTPGQVVAKGDVIATLDPTFAGADLSQLAGRDLALRAQVERLRSQVGDPTQGAGALAQQADQRALLADRQAAHAARLKQYDETIARLKAALEGNLADQRVTAERTRSLLDLEQMLEKLVAENFGAQARVLETRERRLEAERELTLARNRQSELEREIRVTEAERQSYVTDFRQRVREELTQAVRDSDEVRDQLSKAQRRADLVTLTAPQDAVVLEVRQTSIGSVLNPAEVFAVLVPLGEDLLAEVDIDPADVGEIRVGDRVRIKLDAYPFQKFGVLEGTLQTVSGDAFVTEGTAGGGPRTVYRVRVTLDSKAKGRLSEAVRLLPGMTATAEVIVGQRTVLSYFLYPLMRAVDESIRER
ncbi:MAG: HlyD family type I secretion periplasmic adaptor subunit [Burkholderiaceae bacterium]|jgi:HlyD family secretion protein|nr:HlyD family type I secretion periplasmic adaptor subunit [Burkholderiaceae bacterium]